MIKHIITTALIILLFSIGLWAAGCVQRECSYDPSTGIVHYKSNYVATDASADAVTLKTPGGIVIKINNVKQDSDKAKIVTPYGIIETSN